MSIDIEQVKSEIQERMAQLGMTPQLLARAIPMLVCEYESGIREPSLPTILAYVRIAGITVEQIIDDDLDLTL